MRYEPMPLGELPDVLERFVVESAAAIGCAPEFVALPTLATVAAAIGTARAIELKEGWPEPPIIWAAIVARSGAQKSPAMDAALVPLRAAQRDAFAAYEIQRDEHAAELLRHERDLADWRKDKGGDDPPRKPVAPAAVRYIVGDVTVEALAPILAANPRGVLLARDELSAWLGSFDRYTGGRGSDSGNWLEMWRGRELTNDRKTGDKRTIYVPRAAVSVCGTVQPGTLARMLTAAHFESGLAARLLLVNPPERIRVWSERVPPAGATEPYKMLIGDLIALEHVDGEPVRLPLTPDAREAWRGWYNAHAKRIGDAETDAQAAALSKAEAYGARLSLIFALCVNPAATAVDADALRRGCRLADWIVAETLRVYGLLHESDEARADRLVLEHVGKAGGRATVRELQRAGPLCGRTADDIELVLGALVARGIGRWETIEAGPRGGRSTRRFVLADVTDTDTTLENTEKTGVVSVSVVSAEQNGQPEPAADGGAATAPWGEL